MMDLARRGTLRFPLRTTLGAHHVASEVAAYAWGLGLHVERCSAGGWFAKTHYFVVKGDLGRFAQLEAFVKAVEAHFTARP